MTEENYKKEKNGEIQSMILNISNHIKETLIAGIKRRRKEIDKKI